MFWFVFAGIAAASPWPVKISEPYDPPPKRYPELSHPGPNIALGKPVTGSEATDLDFKLSRHAWMEEGQLVTVIVGKLATRDRDGYPYMPLEIAVANNGLRQLGLTLESFALVDEERNRYPAANPRELIEGYTYLDLDRFVAELDRIVHNKFAAYARYPSNFSPTVEHDTFEVVRDLVSLPRGGYMVDMIYFPAPAGGIRDKRFELFVDSQHLPEPVSVKFVVD